MSNKRDCFIESYKSIVASEDFETLEDYFNHYDSDSMNDFIKNWGTGAYSHLTDHWMMWCDAWQGEEEKEPPKINKDFFDKMMNDFFKGQTT